MQKNTVELTLSALAERLNLGTGVAVRVVGDGTRVIRGVAAPEDATSDTICPVWDERAMAALEDKPDVPVFTQAQPSEVKEEIKNGIIIEISGNKNARAYMPQLLAIFEPKRQNYRGVDPKAAVAIGAKIDPSAWIGPCAVVEDGAVIEQDAVIEPGAFIGENCHVGAGTVVEANATLRWGVRVGKNCLLHSGCVLGADGFGFVPGANGPVKIPQIGSVEIGDNVEIGACTTIDRGTVANTVIGSGTKIDNHVQIGHNVKMGRGCIICSMTGIAGSSVIEDGVTLSVQVGVTDHVKIGRGALLAARSGVTNDIPAGAVMSGFPARPHTEAKRALVLSASLPELFKRLRTLERKLDELRG